MTEIEVDRMWLIRSFSKTAHHDFLLHYHFLLVDAPAGTSKTVILFCLASSEPIVVISPEHNSLTDAHTLLQILSLNGFKGKIYKEFNSILERNLGIELLLLGLIYQDGTMEQAVQQQKILLSVYPQARA